MYFPQNQEENRTTSTEETERPLPESSKQASSNIPVFQPQLIQQDKRQYHAHHHIDQQSVQVDQRQYHAHHHQQVVQVDKRQNITKIILQPEQSNVRSGDQEGPNGAFDKLKKTTGKLYDRKFDVDVSKFDNPASNLPEVYPELLSIDFYEGRFIPNDDQYDPKTRQIKFEESDKKVSIDELISKCQLQNFISIVGYPGAGKTTLSKRLARHLNQNEDFLVLRIPFMNMSDCDDEELTLKEFLLGDVKFNLKDEEQNVIFSWMKDHAQNCFFVFDGFDQVNWNLTDKVKKSNYDTLLTCQELVSNLCRETFLPNCHIAFTSRPHAMLKIPKKCRPNQTYFVGDLTSENMKTLLDAFINDEQKSREILDKLTAEIPHLESMCHNPLMLQLYLRASLGSSHKILNVSTMTRIFYRVLENLKSSEHAISLSDQIVISLSKLAFKATENKTVLITPEDLDRENLTGEQVQALVVTLFGSNRSCGLLEGNRRLYFSHQTFQEFFSALYMVHQMPLDNFKSFVKTNLLVDHWSVVVEFLSGLLLDPDMNKDTSTPKAIQPPSKASTSSQTPSSSHQPSSSATSSSQSSSFFFQLKSKTLTLKESVRSTMQKIFLPKPTDEKMQKKQLFVKKLLKETRKVAANDNDWRSIIPISKILREGNDLEVTVTAGSHFDGGRIRMYDSDTQNDIHAVTSFIQSMPTRLGFLGLSGCEMNSNEFLPWKEAIKSMPGSIVRMYLDGNLLCVDDVIEVLHKIEEAVWMLRSLDDGEWGRDPNKEERSKLQEALDRLDNKKLKIQVGIDDDGNRIYLKHKDC